MRGYGAGARGARCRGCGTDRRDGRRTGGQNRRVGLDKGGEGCSSKHRPRVNTPLRQTGRVNNNIDHPKTVNTLSINNHHSPPSERVNMLFHNFTVRPSRDATLAASIISIVNRASSPVTSSNPPSPAAIAFPTFMNHLL